MLRRICCLIVVGSFLFSVSGCAVVGTALSAAAAYGIYKATHK